MALHGKNHVAEGKDRLIAVLRSISDGFKGNKFLKYIKDGSGKALCLFTAHAVSGVLAQRNRVSRKLAPLAHRAGNGARSLCSKAGQRLACFGRGIANPFIKMARAPRLMVNGFRNCGIKGVFSVFFCGVRRCGVSHRLRRRLRPVR